MNCYTAGIIGIGMLSASFATMSVNQEQQNFLRQKLSPELGNKYGEIVIERRNLYFQGLLLGFLVAFFLQKLIVNSMTQFHRVSFVIAVALPIAVIYYFLMPKSDYMLNHLKTPEENQAWLKVYNTMKHRYFLGLLLGMMAGVPIAMSMCAL